MLVRWKFDDPATGDTYTVEMNPKECNSPARQPHYEYVETTAPDGVVLVFEGNEPPPKLEFSGRILHESHYKAIDDWAQRKRQIKITDDLERQFLVLWETFIPTRKASARYPWKHDFRASTTILEELVT